MGGGRGKQYCLQIPICIDLPQVDCVSAEGVRDTRKASECMQPCCEMCVSDDQKKALRKFKINFVLYTLSQDVYQFTNSYICDCSYYYICSELPLRVVTHNTCYG